MPCPASREARTSVARPRMWRREQAGSKARDFPASRGGRSPCPLIWCCSARSTAARWASRRSSALAGADRGRRRSGRAVPGASIAGARPASGPWAWSIRTPSPCPICSVRVLYGHRRCRERPDVPPPPAGWSELNPHVAIEPIETALTLTTTPATSSRPGTWCSTAPTNSPSGSSSTPPAWRRPQSDAGQRGAHRPLDRSHVGVFEGRPCYRCLVPRIPPEGGDLRNSRGGRRWGLWPGSSGSMMALEAVKLIVGAVRGR